MITENARKQLKTRQNIFKICCCKETENINIRLNFMSLQLFVFELQQNKKITA